MDIQNCRPGALSRCSERLIKYEHFSCSIVGRQTKWIIQMRLLWTSELRYLDGWLLGVVDWRLMQCINPVFAQVRGNCIHSSRSKREQKWLPRLLHPAYSISLSEIFPQKLDLRSQVTFQSARQRTIHRDFDTSLQGHPTRLQRRCTCELTVSAMISCRLPPNDARYSCASRSNNCSSSSSYFLKASTLLLTILSHLLWTRTRLSSPGRPVQSSA